VVYRRLIRDFPKSQYIPDAWLAFGEFYFQHAPDEEKDVKKALDAYVEAAKNEQSQIFGYATYKQGWCHYNLTRFLEAARLFHRHRGLQIAAIGIGRVVHGRGSVRADVHTDGSMCGMGLPNLSFP